MIYQNYNFTDESTNAISESIKERNLYYKIFCGCIFNELLPGYNKRIEGFFEKLADKFKNTDEEKGLILNYKKRKEVGNIINKIKNSKKLHVDFDHHIWHIPWIKTDDRGEFADICITDPESKSLIAIEVKYLSNIDYEKDVENDKDEKSNIGRLAKIKSEGWDVLLILLIKESKWGNMGKNKKRIKDYIKEEENNIPLLVIFWKDIKEMLNKEDETKVAAEYLEKALKVKK